MLPLAPIQISALANQSWVGNSGVGWSDSQFGFQAGGLWGTGALLKWPNTALGTVVDPSNVELGANVWMSGGVGRTTLLRKNTGIGSGGGIPLDNGAGRPDVRLIGSGSVPGSGSGFFVSIYHDASGRRRTSVHRYNALVPGIPYDEFRAAHTMDAENPDGFVVFGNTIFDFGPGGYKRPQKCPTNEQSPPPSATAGKVCESWIAYPYGRMGSFGWYDGELSKSQPSGAPALTDCFDYLGLDGAYWIYRRKDASGRLYYRQSQ